MRDLNVSTQKLALAGFLQIKKKQTPSQKREGEKKSKHQTRSDVCLYFKPFLIVIKSSTHTSYLFFIISFELRTFFTFHIDAS
jgi:hypothetical protein